MTADAVALLEQALGLPESDRGELAARLIDSLDSAEDADVEEAWGAEIQNRIEEIQSGKVQPIPWAEARRMILDDTDESAAP